MLKSRVGHYTEHIGVTSKIPKKEQYARSCDSQFSIPLFIILFPAKIGSLRSSELCVKLDTN